MKKRGILCIMLAFVMIMTLMLAGCKAEVKPQDVKETTTTTGSTTGGSTEKKEVGDPNLEGNLYLTGYPIVKDKVSLSVIANRRHDVKDFNEIAFYKELEEKTNVHIDFEQVPTDSWGEKKNLIFASGDLPDAFYGNWVFEDADVLKYGTQGLLLPINNYIDKYSNFFTGVLQEYPHYKSLITAPDGNIYGLPTFKESVTCNTAEGLFINKNWLDKLGLNMPTNADELYKVLKAFKAAGDLNGNGQADEIPFTFKFKNWINGTDQLLHLFGITDTGDHIMMRGDKVVYAINLPEYKEAIAYLHKLYAEELIDVESFTQDGKVTQAKMKQTPAILGLASYWSNSWAFGKPDGNEFVILPVMEQSNGQKIWEKRGMGGISRKGGFVITTSCKTPEVAFRWGDTAYDFDVAVQSEYGMYGVNIEKDANNNIKFLPTPEGMTQEEFKHTVAPGVNGFTAISFNMAQKMEMKASDQEREDFYNKYYKPFQPEYFTTFPPMYLLPEEQQRKADLSTDITAFVDEHIVNWIVNGGVEKEWDSFQAELKKLGVEEYVKLQQDAYDRFNK